MNTVLLLFIRSTVQHHQVKTDNHERINESLYPSMMC